MLISEHCVYPAHFRQDGAGPCLCISGLSATANMQRTEVLYEPTASCLLGNERELMFYIHSTFGRKVVWFSLMRHGVTTMRILTTTEMFLFFFFHRIGRVLVTYIAKQNPNKCRNTEIFVKCKNSRVIRNNVFLEPEIRSLRI